MGNDTAQPYVNHGHYVVLCIGFVRTCEKMNINLTQSETLTDKIIDKNRIVQGTICLQ